MSVADVKFGFFWFDRVIFDSLIDGKGPVEHFYNGLFSKEPDRGFVKNNRLCDQVEAFIVPIARVVDGEAIEDVTREQSEKLSAWEAPDLSDPDPVRQAYRAGIEYAAEAERNSPWGIMAEDDNRFRSARGGIHTVRMWQKILRKGPAALLCTPQEETALRYLGPLKPQTALLEPHRLGRLLLPDLSGLTWEALARAKTSSHYDALLDQIETCLAEGDGDVALAKERFKRVTDAIADVALERMRPAPWLATLSAALTNAPISPVNPFALIGSARTIWRDYKAQEDLGWFYLLRDLRNTTAPRRGR